MNKIEKLKKWIKVHKAMEPSSFTCWLPLFALFFGAILYDLDTLYNVSLTFTKGIIGFVFLTSSTYLLCWFVEGLILAIYTRVCYHKTIQGFEDCLDWADKEFKEHEDK